MDLLTFTERVVSHIVWPLTATVLALVFRSEVRGILGRISQLKFHGADLRFQHEARELESIRRELPNAKVEVLYAADKRISGAVASQGVETETLEPLTATDVQERPLDSSLVLSPRARVDESWHRIELSLQDLATVTKISTPKSFRGILGALTENGILNETLENALERLHASRNKIIRARGPLDPKVVSAFVNTADKLQLLLQNLAGV